LKRIYVGNLPYQADEQSLQTAFAEYGAVSNVSIIRDRETGNSRGFAFVEMDNDDEADAAIEGLNGQAFEGRTLTVNVARPRSEGGGGRRFGGARSGNRY
jgi:RNA recognition motif-containing protein